MKLCACVFNISASKFGEPVLNGLVIHDLTRACDVTDLY
jgi:hypothetical protein